jgi:hypothetical protein
MYVVLSPLPSPLSPLPSLPPILIFFPKFSQTHLHYKSTDYWNELRNFVTLHFLSFEWADSFAVFQSVCRREREAEEEGGERRKKEEEERAEG